MAKCRLWRRAFVPEGQHDGSQGTKCLGKCTDRSSSSSSSLSLGDRAVGEDERGIRGEFCSYVPEDGRAGGGRRRRRGGLRHDAKQALRAWLLSACPSGTKAIRPSKTRIKLAFLPLRPGPWQRIWISMMREPKERLLTTQRKGGKK
jgi:hypothetical protein